ncbi:MAG: CehA/McbA family metallohydrolase [Armatimonadota bacterium]
MPRCAWLVVIVALAAQAAAYGAPAFTFTAPAENATVSGVIEVKVALTPTPGEELTSPVVQTIDGKRFPLFSDGAGAYVGLVDTAKLPNGHQTLLAFATPKGRDARREEYADESWGADRMARQGEVAIVVRNPYRFLWGDLHAHTSYSDGGWYPNEAYKYARDVAKLDFFAVTDHDWVTTLDEYADIVAQANTFDEPGRFVALYGFERTNGDSGHMCFYMTDTTQTPNGLTDCYRYAAENGLLGHFNHPWPNKPDQSWRNDFEEFRYAPEADRAMAMVELRAPDEEACYLQLLNNGWHVGAAGCEDKHDATWGQGPSWTVALAKEVSRKGVLDALWARRTYSAADRNLKLEFTLDGEDMGAQVSRRAGPYTFAVTVDDPDETDKIERVDLFLDGRIVKTAVAGPAETVDGWSDSLQFPAGRHYVFVRVTQSGGRMSWSSPIWLTAYESAPNAKQ